MPFHPLEPLTAAEVAQAVALLRGLPVLTPTTRIISLTLREPDKAFIYALPSASTPDREANAVLFDNGLNTAYTIALNLTEDKVTAQVAAPSGSQPMLSVDEQTECEQAVINSEEFRAALERQYGISDTSLVMVDIWSAGNYGAEEDSTYRLTRPLCFLRTDATDNGYARPIEGIRPVVDLNLMQVIRVEEYGHWPLPPKPGNYAADRVPNQRTDIKPLIITQPDGPSFTMNGNSIAWQKWDIVIGFNAREGLTLHDIRYTDMGKKRPILYRASLTEMVVPYGDPNPASAQECL